MIFSALAFFERERRNETNAYSRTVAVGFASILNGFGGSGQKIRESDLLPYLTDESGGAKKLSDKTRQIVNKLNFMGKVPPFVMGGLMIFKNELD